MVTVIPDLHNFVARHAHRDVASSPKLLRLAYLHFTILALSTVITGLLAVAEFFYGRVPTASVAGGMTLVFLIDMLGLKLARNQFQLNGVVFVFVSQFMLATAAASYLFGDHYYKGVVWFLFLILFSVYIIGRKPAVFFLISTVGIVGAIQYISVNHRDLPLFGYLQDQGESAPIATSIVAVALFIYFVAWAFERSRSQNEADIQRVHENALGVAEGKLERRNQYIRNIMDSMPSMMFTLNRERKITGWNTAATDILNTGGVKVEESTARELPVLLKAEIDDYFNRNAFGRGAKLEKISKEVNGASRIWNMDFFPLSENTEEIVIRIDDVTARVHLENMMIQSEKMMSLGTLAAGMAHELNNPLAGIIQTAQVMESRLNSNLNSESNSLALKNTGISTDAVATFLKERSIISMIHNLQEAGARAAHIVKSMLSFSRQSAATTSTEDLSALLEHTLVLAAADFDLKTDYDFKHLEIVRNYAADVPRVLCEPTKLQQVFLNVLRNAAQAMQEAGVAKPLIVLRIRNDQRAGWVRIDIEDNGPGMHEVHAKRIFEPFFTTKPVGEGTGLGMSISYFIVTEIHKGEMLVETRPGEGTSIVMRLPAGEFAEPSSRN